MGKVWEENNQQDTDRPRNWRQLERRQGQPRSDRSTPHPARKVDPDSCPAGYDPDVWNLVLLFGQLATAKKVHLAAGRPLLYAMLEDRVTDLSRELDDAKESGKGVWSVDGVTKVATWQELTEAAIQHEWTYIQDAYAADWFCNPVRFREMIDAVRTRGVNLRAGIKMKELRAEREASGYYDEMDEQMMNPPLKAPKKPRPEFIRGHAV